MTIFYVYLAGVALAFVAAAVYMTPALNEQRTAGGKRTTWGYWANMTDSELLTGAMFDYLSFAIFWPLSVPLFGLLLLVKLIADARA